MMVNETGNTAPTAPDREDPALHAGTGEESGVATAAAAANGDEPATGDTDAAGTSSVAGGEPETGDTNEPGGGETDGGEPGGDELDAKAPETVEEHETGEPDSAGDKRRARLRAALRLKVLIPSVVFLLVLAAAIFFGANYFQYQAQESARSTALAGGKRILTHFMTFDYKKLNDNVDSVTADASHGFRSQYKQLVNQLRGTIKKAKASSKPEILASGITRVDGKRADLVFLANTTVKNTQVKSPRADPWRVKLTLTKENGSWKLDGLSFL